MSHAVRPPVRTSALATLTALLLTSCGGNDGPAVHAQAQSLSLLAAPDTVQAGDNANIAARASSGLTVHYSSSTPEICRVDAASGQIHALDGGECRLSASQPGNNRYAPAPPLHHRLTVIANQREQTLRFDTPPALSQGALATVRARASSGLAARYRSLTPALCSVDATSGQVRALASSGACIIAASQPGNARYHAATPIRQTLTIAATSAHGVPAMPADIRIRAGQQPNSIDIHIGSLASGGSPILGYHVHSTPPGISRSIDGDRQPITLNCAGSCAGYSFSVAARNAQGRGAASAPVDIITRYNVVERFYEPDTQPCDTIFRGSFTLNASRKTVTGLSGTLTESMTGDSSSCATPGEGMTTLALHHQLSVRHDASLGGLLVTTFLHNHTNTLSIDPKMSGTDGWSPGSGEWFYYNFPKANPGNAYAMIFVNPDNPLAPLTPAQINKLAYADCAPGGMMGDICMTGTTRAGYGTIGSMSGYPVAQTITRAAE